MKPHINRLFTANKLHHKLMILMSLPLFLWVLSGCYFVWLDLAYIRGDHYVQPYSPIKVGERAVPLSKFTSLMQNAHKVETVMIANSPFYRIHHGQTVTLINANSGKNLNQITRAQAIDIAQSVISNNPAKINFHALFIEQQAPSEIAARHLPVWRVSFDDRVNSTIYISAKTGSIVARRHDFWRIFDLFWRIHIMDYDDGENVNNWFLLLSTIIALIAILSGVIWQSKWLKRGRI